MGDGGQQYCLRWNNYSENITSEFETLLGQEDFVDVTLACEKQSIKAHKVVLSACSSYFRKLLKENPCQHPIIILKDVAYSELTALLYFMYHGQVMVEQENISRLLQIAQLLEVRGLSEVTNNLLEDEMQEKTDGKRKASSSAAPSPSPPLSMVVTPGLLPFTLTRPSKTPTPPPAKRCKPARPVPMLQSILSQRLSTPPSLIEPNPENNQAARTLTALAARLQSTPNSSGATSGLTLEALLVSKDTSERSLSNRSNASSEDHSQKDGDEKSGLMNDADTSVDAEFEDSAIRVKEEPPVDFDDYPDDSTRGGSGDEDDGEMEGESGGEGSGGECGSFLPLLAQHLASPLMLSASAKLCAAATHAKMASTSQPATPPADTSDGETPRKLAFHEPRPCPICHRMYRDAATLRTHTAIMHAEGKDPFTCLCGQMFRTKYEMYTHKKNGHR